MKPGSTSSRGTVLALFFVACAAQLAAAPARSQTVVGPDDRLAARAQPPLLLAQYRECSRRIGPFVTQSTAWQRWREAQSQGYAVSNGVVPCHEGATRGYCFVAYFRC
jgi:hypothetical protein